MDFPSKNMYDTFKDEIWKELGPLDPDWFEALTAQTNEGNVSDQEELCANHEGHFKTPFDKTAADSQLFSTPKAFRRSQVVSPETEDEQSFNAGQEKETLLCTATESPSLFRMSKEGVPVLKYGGVPSMSQGCFDLLHTPQKSPVSYAKQISESLGAQIHPDMSWTSSLNTPPAVPSTLILTKTDESPCTVSVSADKSVVFVRKLFPSLSNASSVGVVSPKDNDKTTFHQDVISHGTGQNPESHDSTQSPLNQSDGVWRQRLPDAIEDGEIRRAVASVLEGAENVLSIFFTNSSAELRKVKTDRIKGKQIIPTKEHGCSSMDISTTNNTASSEQTRADQERSRLPLSPPVKTEDTQWSPLSLSEIPPCIVDTSCHNNSSATQVKSNIFAGQARSDSDSGQLIRQPVKITNSGFTKKKRQFVYTVKTSKLQVRGKETQFQIMDSSQGIPDSVQGVNVKQLGKAPDEADHCSIKKNERHDQGNLSEENLPSSVQVKVQDMDMSQLCRDFAQDFSQMSDAGKVAEDTAQSCFSPSACLSAMKQAKQKAKQTNLHHDCDDGFSNRRHVSPTKQSNSINEGTVTDSGFQSAVADITQVTASFVLPSWQNSGHRQQWTAFKTDTHRTTCFPCENKGNGKAHLDDILQETKTDTKLPSAIKENQTLGRESDLHIERTLTQLAGSAKGTIDTINCIPLNGQVKGSQQAKTTVSLPSFGASGFKTASNKGIQISSANLQRAKRLFEEIEGETTCNDQPTKCAHQSKDDNSTSNGSVKNTTCNPNQPNSSEERNVGIGCQLTASQKADVTELCTLLEEADSQFEFTQFKTAKVKQHCEDSLTSPQKVDPDFLAGIDFDDSFSSDAEKHPAVTVVHDKMTSLSDGKTNCDTFNITNKATGLLCSSVMTKENASTEDVSSPSKHISEGTSSILSAKPKNLDIAGHTKTMNLENINPLMLGVGFKTAGGNVLRVSKKCLSKARALFADLENNLLASQNSPDQQSNETDGKTRHKLTVDNYTGKCFHHKDGNDAVLQIQGCSEKKALGATDEDATILLKSSKMDTTTSGFQMASGKGISISAKALQEVDGFFKDCGIMDANADMSVKHETSIDHSGSVSHKKKLKSKNVQGLKMNFPKEPITEFENVNSGPTVCHVEVQNDVKINNFAFKTTLPLTDAASFQGNPPLTAKTLSSLSGSTSKTVGSPCFNELRDGDGFCTASGEKVFISCDAMKKAECLLTEIHILEDTNKQLKQKGDSSRTGDLNSHIQDTTQCGFQTASGKGFTISSAALKKAKLSLNECEEVKDEIGENPTHSEMPVPSPEPRKLGFLAASGKPVALSAEALQRAKALFSDISFSAEVPAVLRTRNIDKRQDSNENTAKMHCGFSTAAGAKVHVSQKSLLKAKSLLKEFDDSVSAEAMQESDAFFKDCDIMECSTVMSGKHDRRIAPVSGISKFKPSEMVTSISDVFRGGHAESQSVNTGSAGHHDKMLQCDDVEIHNGIFKNTLDFTNAASLHGNTSLMAKPLPFSLCPTSKNIASDASGELSNSGGFCTANGKRVSVSDDAMAKAKSLLNENASYEDTNKQLQQKGQSLLTQNGGFQTAGGKGVIISSAALKKAKTMLHECEGVGDEISVKPTHSKTPVRGQLPRNCGFHAANGKPVALSAEALQKAKALFSGISVSAEVPAVSDTMNAEKKQDSAENMEEIHCGFSTAGGAKVHVSKKNLLKAKSLLKEFADGDCHDSNSFSLSPHDSHRSDPAEVKDVKRISDSIPTKASDKDLYTKESVPLVVKSFTSLPETDQGNEALQTSSVHGFSFKEKAPTTLKFKEGNVNPSRVYNLHDGPGEEMSSVLDYEITQTSSGERTEESSLLYFKSLNLNGCTETQQKFLAQEALDCTKALLEDENLAGQSLSMTIENMPLQDDNQKYNNMSVPDHKETGKRLMEDTDVTAQPPLKRRLLEEFNRTDPTGSTLHPEKSCPNVVMTDSRVFRGSVSLHPNITKPDGYGRNYAETILQKTTQHSTPGDSRILHSKMSAFVPPFLDNAKTTSRKNTLPKDNIRTPSAFIPPFKKQRTVVQESSSKPQEEDKCHLFVTPFNRGTYVTPTKKTQRTAEDIQMVALADTTTDNLINNQNLPVGCGSKDAVVEASHVEDIMSGSQDMFQNLHNIELARDMQDMRIRKKKRQTIRPLPGSLFLTKTSGVLRLPLKAAVNGKPPARYTQKQLHGHGVHQHVYEITSDTAESFRFSLQQFIKREAFIDGGGVQLADGGWLIPSNDGTVGKEEFYRALCDTPGVEPKLISEEWVYNHYRWIVWKRASMERSFPETMGSLCLTPEQVLLQLKYRYDVEVDHSRRPALRKIMEKDDTAAKTLVLCVCGVVSRGNSPRRQSFSNLKTPQGADAKVENPSAVVWLTDGWYAIKAQMDEPLTAMLHKGRLAVGGKLIIHGAQLVGSQDACSPLEAPESLMLKICANSSRLARWNAKLGFYRDPRPFLLPVACLYSNGGPVGCVDIIILRSYPIQWMERKPDGGVVFRSVRGEEKEASRYNDRKQKAMEILFVKIQSEFEKEEKGNNKPPRRRRTISRQDIAGLQDGEELYEAVGDDPAYLEAHLSEPQLETLRAYRRSLMEKKQAELQDRYRRALENAEESDGSFPKRDVTPVWRLCIADSIGQPGSVYQLNLWRPSSDLQSFLREGCRYKVFNLTSSDGKKHGGSTTVQLTGTKKTQFQDLQASQEWLSVRFQPRVSTQFVDLQNPEFLPPCGEVDLTGYVISIINGQGSSPAFYLADGNLNFVKVRCFSSLAQSGLEDVVKLRILLALSNLQLRGQATSPTPVVYAGDLTVFSTNPKEVHLRESLGQLKVHVQGQKNFFLTAEQRLSHFVRSDCLSSNSSPALQTQTPVSTTDRRRGTTTSVTCQHSVRSLGSFTPVSRNLPGTICSTEKDPSSLKRRRALEYLSRIPSPPPLSHLSSAASPYLNKTFNPPRRSGTPSTLKTVQTPESKPVDSPVADEWVNDEELAMIDTQALLVGDLM